MCNPTIGAEGVELTINLFCSHNFIAVDKDNRNRKQLRHLKDNKEFYTT